MALLTRKDSLLLLDVHLHEIRLAVQQGQLQHFAIANSEHALYGVAAREVLQHWIYGT